MIIFLYGPDDWRREQNKKFIIEELKKKHPDLNLAVFDLSEENRLTEFHNFVRNQSIFGAEKTAVLENAFSAEGGDGSEKEIAGELKYSERDHSITVLLSERKMPPKAFGFLLGKPTVSQEFEYLAGKEWTDFINHEARNLGVSLEGLAVNLLTEIYKENTWGAVTELRKLSNLKRGTIRLKDLEELSLDVMPNYWQVFQGLKSGSAKSRLWALERMFLQNEPPPRIFNILASQWREKFPALAEYDVKIKSGKLDYEEALLDLVIG